VSVTIFVCNDPEQAWIDSLCAASERERAAWERDEDLDHEEAIGKRRRGEWFDLDARTELVLADHGIGRSC
jgi:hypothetical protein